MTPLAQIIRGDIHAAGPLPVSRFMALALAHPRHGYYTTRDPFGCDFTTAPEISQMFGELIGAWAADTWLRLGAPASVTLAELGPGRGTLMADAVRAARTQPGFAQAAQICLVEISPTLTAVQRQRVAPAAQAAGFAAPIWVSDIGHLPDGPLIVLANEFFDALPIRQFVKTDRGWCERCVAEAAGALAFMAAPTPLADTTCLPPTAHDAQEGAILEVSPARDSTVLHLGERLAAASGAALIVDYGYTQSRPGDTLQALHNGAPTPVLHAPGDSDITAHVDFEALARAVPAGCTVHGPIPQGQFLARLGLEQRAAALSRSAPQHAPAIAAAAHRLTADDAMGTLFKVMAITGSNVQPAGF